MLYSKYHPCPSLCTQQRKYWRKISQSICKNTKEKITAKPHLIKRAVFIRNKENIKLNRYQVDSFVRESKNQTWSNTWPVKNHVQFLISVVFFICMFCNFWIMMFYSQFSWKLCHLNPTNYLFRISKPRLHKAAK